jgi:hypothetical protein
MEVDVGVALAGPWRKPKEEVEQGRLWLFWFSGFLLPNERGAAGPNREREAWPWLLVLGASFKMPGAAGWYVRRRKKELPWFSLLLFQGQRGEGGGLCLRG